MTTSKQSKAVNVGIDVGKFQLDVYILERDKYFSVSNTEPGIRDLIRRLQRYSVERIVMEATGRYEMAFATAAFEKRLPVCIVKPQRVRQFARASDQWAKTDKLDAQVIAQFGAMMAPRFSIEKSKNLLLIKDLVIRRRQLVQMRTQEQNREKVMDAVARRSCTRIIRLLNKDIEWVEERLAKAVQEEDAWAERKERPLASI